MSIQAGVVQKHQVKHGQLSPNLLNTAHLPSGPTRSPFTQGPLITSRNDLLNKPSPASIATIDG